MGRPLRICMVTTFYPPFSFGGDGIFVQRLSDELARRGHHVEVIHCIDAYRWVEGREPAQGYSGHPDVVVHGLRSRFGALSLLATQQIGGPFLEARKIRTLLERDFDVIHYHNISLVGGPRILEYGRGIKLYTVHEYWLICPTHTLFKYNRAACVRPHCLACTIAYRRPPQWWRYFGLLDASVKHVDAFIAPSRFSREMHQRMGLDAPIVRLPPFVPRAAAAAPPAAEDTCQRGEEPYFLFVGRLEKLKGLQTLIPLFRRYPKAQLWIAGEGSYEPQLRSLAHGSTNVRFLGHVANEQLGALYHGALALIVPSLCYEIFAQVIIEAFQQKTPVIVRDLGGMPELVEESGAGFVYATEDGLVAAMDRLVSDPAYRNRLGLRASEAYRRRWTPEAHLEAYFGLIRQIAETRRSPAVGRPAD